MWRSKRKPTCNKRKREDDHEGEKLNSSFQVPSYARITNTRVKAGGTLHLLTLPDHLRSKIFSLAVIEDESIEVSTKHPEASAEPGLLSVSHDVRNEAMKIFYSQNDFDLQVHDFDAAALLPWLDRTSKYRNPIDATEAHDKSPTTISALFTDVPTANLTPTQTWVLEQQRIYHANLKHAPPTRIGETALSVNYAPNWANFVAWLKLWHADRLLRPGEDDEDTVEEKTTFAVFEVVDGLRGEKWEVVQKTLPGLRAMLGAVDARWVEEATERE